MQQGIEKMLIENGFPDKAHNLALLKYAYNMCLKSLCEAAMLEEKNPDADHHVE
jgi:hypothetical protein